MNNNIVLIGFMGVGKSSTTRKLSKELGFVSIDTDDLIESMEGRRIKLIFSQSGEEYFRDLEKRVATWIEKSVQNSIISTGGGFFMVPNIKNIGKIIYLKSSFDGIIDRINKHKNAKQKFAKRPLLSDRKKAKELFDKREKIYENLADITINMQKHKTIKSVVKEIKSHLNANDQ
ncbi:MAG: shikimate kinase [Campylobacteraceae bacterium]